MTGCQDYIINFGGSVSRGCVVKKNIAPCVTRARAGDRGFYSTRCKRVLTTADFLALQGVQYQDVQAPGVTDRQLRLMAGNAWSLNVAAKVLKSLVECVGLGRDGLKDPWS